MALCYDDCSSTLTRLHHVKIANKTKTDCEVWGIRICRLNVINIRGDEPPKLNLLSEFEKSEKSIVWGRLKVCWLSFWTNYALLDLDLISYSSWLIKTHNLNACISLITWRLITIMSQVMNYFLLLLHPLVEFVCRFFKSFCSELNETKSCIIIIENISADSDCKFALSSLHQALQNNELYADKMK